MRRFFGRQWPRWTGAFVGALVVGGVISGIAALQSRSDDQQQLDQFMKSTNTAYEEQGRRQAQIDLLYESCSSTWVAKTAENSTQSLVALFALRDQDALTTETARNLERLCSDGDIAAYCNANALAIMKYAKDAAALGTKEDVERGCLKRNGAYP